MIRTRPAEPSLRDAFRARRDAFREWMARGLTLSPSTIECEASAGPRRASSGRRSQRKRGSGATAVAIDGARAGDCAESPSSLHRSAASCYVAVMHQDASSAVHACLKRVRMSSVPPGNVAQAVALNPSHAARYAARKSLRRFSRWRAHRDHRPPRVWD